MKAFLITIITLLLTSIAFRFLHFPGAGLLTVMLVILFFIFAILNSVVKKKVGKLNMLGGWVIHMWICYFVFKTMYWPGATTMVIPAAILTLIYFVDILRSKEKQWSPLVVIFASIGFLLYLQPTHRLFYIVDLNGVFNKEIKEERYDKWNTYSWLLYRGGKKQEAKVANAKAIEILEKTYADGYIIDFTGYKYKPDQEMYESELEELKANREAILLDNWNSFNY